MKIRLQQYHSIGLKHMIYGQAKPFRMLLGFHVSLAHDIWMSGSYLNLLWLMVSPCFLHTVTGMQKCAARLLLCQVGSLFCCYACCLPATSEHSRLHFHVLPRTQTWTKESMNSHGKQKQVTFWQHPWQATQIPIPLPRRCKNWSRRLRSVPASTHIFWR